MKFCTKCGLPGSFGTKIRKGKRYELTVCRACTAKYAKEYRKTHDTLRTWHRDYMKSYRKGYREKNPDKIQGSRGWRLANPEKALYQSVRNRNKNRWNSKLTFEEFLIEIGGKMPAVCPILGIPIKVGTKAFANNSASVDRIDNGRPYEKGNIAVISYRANAIKRDGTADEHRRIAKWMETMQR